MKKSCVYLIPNFNLGPIQVYVHEKGNFLSKKRNALTEIKHINHIMDTNIDIKYRRLLSIPIMECTDEKHTYDSCLDNLVTNKLQEHCQLPLVRGHKEMPVCKTNKDIKEALKIFQTSYPECLHSCSQIEVDIKLNPVDLLYTLKNPTYPVKTVIPGYYITIPRAILVSTMQESYTPISFIAEFGGWVGLFLGISVLGIFELLLGLYSCNCRFSKTLKSAGFVCLKAACTVCLAFILFECCKKMISGEIQLDIKIRENAQNISLSFCSMENIYKENQLDGNLTYMGNDPDFWNNLSNLRNKVDSLKIDFQNGEAITLNAQNISKYFDITLITPKLGTYIESCYTTNLKESIMRINFIARKEMSIYVHLTGQLLRSGTPGFTFINSDTVVRSVVGIFCFFRAGSWER